MLHPELHVHVACVENGSSECRRMTIDQAVLELHKGSRTIWINLYGEDDEAARTLLEDRLGFHELAVEDALSDDERPTLQEFEKVLFFVIPMYSAEHGDDCFYELAFFLTDQALVTYCKAKLEVVSTWFERWQSRPTRFGSHPAKLAHTLVDAAVDSYFPITDTIEDEVDEIAELLFGGDVSQVHHIQRLKRRLLTIRRQLSPTRDVLNALLRRDLVGVPDELEPYFQDVLDHVMRLTEVVDANRETLASLLDVHLSTVSNNTNEVMKRMTFYATALMSSALVSGIYGMNFDQMPELHWKVGYPFALFLMVAAFFGVRAFFKFRGWL